mmetsp:Transcript_43254/g.123742  ORF Transcript_43254/g.123742 Transcript_43254/m.123742 type:complete len:222 (-) Transcript_43254:105-770(-)
MPALPASCGAAGIVAARLGGRGRSDVPAPLVIVVFVASVLAAGQQVRAPPNLRLPPCHPASSFGGGGGGGGGGDRRDRGRERSRSRGRDNNRRGGGGGGGRDDRGGGGGDRGRDRGRDHGGKGGGRGGGGRSPRRDKPPMENRSPSRDGDPPNDLIINMLIDREKARIDRDWSEADRIRDELRSKGIEVYDKERRWEAKDGRVGSRPNKDDRKRGAAAERD